MISWWRSSLVFLLGFPREKRVTFKRRRNMGGMNPKQQEHKRDSRFFITPLSASSTSPFPDELDLGQETSRTRHPHVLHLLTRCWPPTKRVCFSYCVSTGILLARRNTGVLGPGFSPRGGSSQGMRNNREQWYIQTFIWSHFSKRRRVTIIWAGRADRKMNALSARLGVSVHVPICENTTKVSPDVNITYPLFLIAYRCDNGRFWLSAHNCQVRTRTSQNLELEQQIRIFGAD
jgi:hypothetical protein